MRRVALYLMATTGARQLPALIQQPSAADAPGWWMQFSDQRCSLRLGLDSTC